MTIGVIILFEFQLIDDRGFIGLHIVDHLIDELSQVFSILLRRSVLLRSILIGQFFPLALIDHDPLLLQLGLLDLLKGLAEVVTLTQWDYGVE